MRAASKSRTKAPTDITELLPRDVAKVNSEHVVVLASQLKIKFEFEFEFEFEFYSKF